MQFVISTQTIENYGAHCEDGKFANGNAYWKFKGGSDYIVSGLDRMADAAAFVMAKAGENSLGYKEFPIEMQTYEEWVAKLPEDEEYREFLMKTARRVSPYFEEVQV
jgi:hypothetical protein